MALGSTAADYLQQLQALTPAGGAFPTDDQANWTLLLTALAQTYARIDESAVSLLNEIWPDTTIELLPNWERIAGLPDECSELGDTIQIRRANLLAKLTLKGGQTKANLIALAAAAGYTITITEFKPFRTGFSRTGDSLGGEPWWFVWQVNSTLNTVTWFRASESSAGDPLASWGNARLECLMQKYSPAHTKVQFAYS